MFNNDRRFGKFRLKVPFIEKNPDLVRAIMGSMIVLRAECLFTSHAIEYEAHSPEFAVISEMEESPVYDVVFNEDLNEDVTVEFVKQGA